jgi:general stress protein 26
MVLRRRRAVSSARLVRVARRLMSVSSLFALATVSAGGRAHISHMYFAWNDRFEIFWISDPDSLHSRNLAARPTAAATVYDSRQTWGRPDRGIQLHGAAGVARGSEGARAYASRFRDFDPEGNDLPLFRFRPRTVKLFDEREFGGATFVTARVTRAGLVWVRTEVLT